MAVAEFSVRECNGHVVVSLREEPDVTGAAKVATALVQVAVLEFIDSSAWQRWCTRASMPGRRAATCCWQHRRNLGIIPNTWRKPYAWTP